MDGTTITYDGNNLQTTNIITQDIDHHSNPTKNAQGYSVSHSNYSAIPFVNYPSKSITISGSLESDTIPNMDTLEDTFKGYFIGKDKFLDIGYGGGTRRYTATAINVQVTRPGNLNYGTFSVTFFCIFPFGRNTSATTALNVAGRTSAVYADSYSFIGTAPVQWPIITVTFTALTGGTNKTVTIGNNASGQSIAVTRTWSVNDALQIDVGARTVTVNGTLVDFTGAFPEFPPGNQVIGYSDGLTTRTFTINVVYYPSYL